MASKDGTDSTRRSGKGSIQFEDAALVQRSRKGDMDAFGLLVTKYQDRVFNMIYRMCGRRAEAEELAQDAFLKALERLDQFRGNSKFYTWLFRIAANLTISHRRRGGRVKFQTLTRSDDFDGGQADDLTAGLAERRAAAPDAMTMAAERARLVEAALNELDDDFRVVVVLRDVENLDYAEIGQVLDLPIGTVKSRLHRARCLLRNRLNSLMEP